MKDKINSGGNLIEVSVRTTSSLFRRGAPKSKGKVNWEITTAETSSKYCGRFAEWISTCASHVTTVNQAHTSQSIRSSFRVDFWLRNPAPSLRSCLLTFRNHVYIAYHVSTIRMASVLWEGLLQNKSGLASHWNLRTRRWEVCFQIQVITYISNNKGRENVQILCGSVETVRHFSSVDTN